MIDSIFINLLVDSVKEASSGIFLNCGDVTKVTDRNCVNVYRRVKEFIVWLNEYVWTP